MELHHTTQNVNQLPTPSFVLDVATLEMFLTRFKKALANHWPNSIISYSFKTNSLPWLIAYMRDNGVWAEVVSDTEYDLAIKLGYTPERIVFNGPIKGREHLRSALQQGAVINLDAKREVAWAAELAREMPERQFAVGLRINWAVEEYLPEENMTGTQGSRFGFDRHNGELQHMIRQLEDAGVRVAGLHMHRNSKYQSLGVYQAAAEIAAEIVTGFNLDVDWIDIGGGFYGSTDGTPTFDDYISVIRKALEPAVDLQRTTLIVEPGGSLIAVPVELHSTVVDVKQAGDSRFVVLDTSRTNLDPLFRRSRPYEIAMTSDSTTLLPEQILSGFTCVEMDRLMTLENSPELQVGDRVVFYKVGAYTMALQALFTEYLPPVYVREEGELSLVRKRWGAEEFVQGHVWNKQVDTSAYEQQPLRINTARSANTTVA